MRSNNDEKAWQSRRDADNDNGTIIQIIHWRFCIDWSHLYTVKLVLALHGPPWSFHWLPYSAFLSRVVRISMMNRRRASSLWCVTPKSFFLSLLSSLHGICSDDFYSFLYRAQSNKIDVVSLSHDEVTPSSRPVFHDIHGEYEKACCVAKKQASWLIWCSFCVVHPYEPAHHHIICVVRFRISQAFSILWKKT